MATWALRCHIQLRFLLRAITCILWFNGRANLILICQKAAELEIYLRDRALPIASIKGIEGLLGRSKGTGWLLERVFNFR
jgi:hypothetical protein